MNTLAPHPPEAQTWQPHELSEPQDPWAGAAEHSGDISPLPHMTPREEAAAFDDIVHDLQRPEIVPQIDAQSDVSAPAGHTTDEERPYTPRHLRLNDEPFTPTPASDIARRNQANLNATLALNQTLRRVEPELLRETNNAISNAQTESIALPAPEQPVPQTAEAERPAKYKGRRRTLGRFARLFSR